MRKRVLICQTLIDLGRDIAHMLPSLGIDAARCSNDARSVMERLSAERFDGLIFYVIQLCEKEQLVSFLTQLRCLFPELTVYLIAFSCADELAALAEELDIDRVFAAPVEGSQVCRRLMDDICGDDDTVIFSRIAAFVMSESVPTHLSAFWYVCCGVQLCIFCPELLGSVTAGLYTLIAERMNIPAAVVERSIRHLLSVLRRNNAVVCGVRADTIKSRDLIALLADGFVSRYDIFRRSEKLLNDKSGDGLIHSS